jgi:lipid-A-disaccharide synthase
MVIAGEASGDLLAAELVQSLRTTLGASHVPLKFFGAGGPRMASAGMELAFDMTAHSVIGLWEVLKKYSQFKALLEQLLKLAIQRQPDLIVCVDFSGFNRRFANAVRQHIRKTGSTWHPRIVQYVSPQVWASRPGRAKLMARDYDLLLSIFPFEKAWYAKNAPELNVEFVGHPIFDRHPHPKDHFATLPPKPLVVLLPGSRVGELKRHLPPIFGAWKKIHAAMPATRALMVLPDEALKKLASHHAPPTGVEFQIGDLPSALKRASLALACTGTVTVECAYFGVPTVAFYRTSWGTYQIGKRIVKVKYLSMPNLLADALLFPEFIQDEATAENLSQAALELLQDEKRRAELKTQLAKVITSLGQPGASRRAAEVIARLMGKKR